MNRQEHLDWSKQRALEYVDLGNLDDAAIRLISDLKKHPMLKSHVGIQFTMMLQMAGHLNTPEQMRHHIEKFN